MKTNNKLGKKVIAGILTFAIMLNIGISIKTNDDSYFPEVSLATMGVQAQSEGESAPWWQTWGEKALDGATGGAVTAIKGLLSKLNFEADYQDETYTVPPGSQVHIYYENGNKEAFFDNLKGTDTLTVERTNAGIKIGK